MVYPAKIYQHEKDLESFINIKGISWLSMLSKKMMASELEQDFYLLNLMDNVLMTEEDFPWIHTCLDEYCKKLNLDKKPLLFLDTSAEARIMSIGEKNCLLIISSAMIELLNEAELKVAIAHELGHIACKHSFYKLLVENFSGITQNLNMIPGMGALGVAAKLPLFDWFRKADLSADRAAVLATGDFDAVLSMIAKLAGGSSQMLESVSKENLLKQAEEYERVTEEMKQGGTTDKISYLFSAAVMNGIMRESPWPTIRIRELLEWQKTEHYQDLLKGNFSADLNEATLEEPPDEESGFWSKMPWKN